MESALAQATISSQKSEREYLTLRESVAGMMEGWQREVKALKEDVRKKEEGWAKEKEDVAVKYRGLIKLVQATK